MHVAGNADGALLAAEHVAGRVDVLVTNMKMPGLQGPELAALLRAKQPDIGVVFIGGNAEEPAIRGGGSDRTWSFLHKPFSFESRRVAVGRALGTSILAHQRRPPQP